MDNKEEKEKTSEDTIEEISQNKPLDKDITDLFGKCIEELNLKTVIVIADIGGKSLLYYKGHFYDVARMVSTTHREFIERIRQEIL